MKYVCIKRFKRQGIGGFFNIPYGTELEMEGAKIYHKGNAICFKTSAAAHDYFSRNDDGKGLERGELTHAIIKRLSPDNFETKQERDDFWKIVWNDSLAQKYRRSEHLTYWLWSDDFYNAPVEDLKYIAELVGVKKGLLKNV